MGQKVHPTAIRLGIIKNWAAKYYVSLKELPGIVLADYKARQYLKKKLVQAAISRVVIERPARNAKVIIYTARPGVIIGKSGKESEKLRMELTKILGVPVQVNVEEVRKPELNAQLVAENVAAQLLKRIAFRRAMKTVMSSAMRAGAKGIKVCVSGRLGGAEIARTEWAREGSVPLHTFRADIDYGFAEALATYGILGIKVWIFKGEILDKK
jgi:small subunit ribosomal protein S3